MNTDRHRSAKVIVVVSIACLAACSVYHVHPLPEHVDLAPALTPRIIQSSRYPVDPADGLDLTEIAALAVQRNPDLMAMRLKNGVADAQAFAAGLLPDPQFAASRDTPVGDDPTLVTGRSRELSLDLRAWLTHGTEKNIAVAERQRVYMETLWQEWQLIQQVRSVAVQYQLARRKVELLGQLAGTAGTQAEQTRRALRNRDITLDQANADLAMYMDILSLLREQQRIVMETGFRLNGLLGLSPEADIQLAALPDPGLPAETQVNDALNSLAVRRPDLLALQAAYQSQEASVYRAVLNQFPAVTVGVNQARDTGDVRTRGLSVTLNLPLFSGSRGDIAVQTATREQMRQEYQARLDEAHAEITGLWRQLHLLNKQYIDLGRRLPQLQEGVNKARIQYRKGNLAGSSFLVLANDTLNRQLEYLDLEQARWTARIALDTLLALPVLPVNDSSH